MNASENKCVGSILVSRASEKLEEEINQEIARAEELDEEDEKKKLSKLLGELPAEDLVWDEV